MKKYLALIVGMLFMLGFAASAFAIHAEIPAETQAVVAKGATQLTIGGEVRVRGEYRSNTGDFNDDTNKTNLGTAQGGYYDLRVRLAIDAQITANTKGRIHLESGSDTADTVTWGAPSSGARGLYGAGNAKKGSLFILEAWMQHTGSGLLGVPAGIKVGHMPLALGNMLFFNHTYFGDDAIVLFADPTKELHVGLLTAKFREGNVQNNDDANGYVALFTYNTKDWGVSGDVTYVDDQTGAGAGVTANDGLHFWNFGLRGNVNVGGVRLYGDVEFQTGSADNVTALGNIPLPGNDHDFKGWAALVGGSFKINPVTLGLEFAYGSGGDDGGVFDDDGDIGGFVTSLGYEKHFTYVYEYRTINACGRLQGGLCNTWYIKGSAAADLAKDVSGNLDLYYLGAAEDVALNGGKKDSYIGFEVDARVAYKVDRNLTYWVEGGYLFAGDVWENSKGDKDDAYAIRHGLQLTF